MEKNKGYLLPSGDAFTDEMACTLVYYPDKPEYRRALGGSLAYLATWIAWEKESEQKGKDAALAWKIAYDLTIGCWQMACLDQLQDDVAEILAIMQLGQSCCDEQDVTDGDQYTDRVTDGVGDVPQNIIDAGYATDAADWDGFADYKCMISHVIVNQLDARLLEIAPIVNSYGAVFGGVAALTAILAVVFGTAGLAIVFGIVAGVGAVSLLYESLIEGDLLVTLAAKVVTNHDELACAVYESDGDAGALVALNDKIDELFTTIEAVILKNMNLGPTLKALYAGRYAQQDIAQILVDAGYELDDFECSCIEQIGEYLVTTNWNVSDDWEDWIGAAGGAWIDADGNPQYGIKMRYGGPTGTVLLSGQKIAGKIGVSHEPDRRYGINSVRFDRKGPAPYNGVFKLGIRTNPHGAPWIYEEFSLVTEWTASQHIYDPQRVMEWDGDIWLIASGGSAGHCWIDTVIIDLDTWLV